MVHHRVQIQSEFVLEAISIHKGITVTQDDYVQNENKTEPYPYY